MSDEPPETCSQTFRYTSIACEILIFGLLGWMIGPAIWGPGGEVIGAMIGAIVGILMMFCTLFYLAGLFGQKRKTE